MRRGLLRLWVVLSALWLVVIITIGERDITTVFVPPIALGAILAGLVWVLEGFKDVFVKPQSTTSALVRRAEVLAGGLLLRFRLQDDMVATVPMVQLFNDSLNDSALASSLHMWSAGANGPLDSLSSHPSIRDYLYNWAIDRSRYLGHGEPPCTEGDDKAVWVTPDRHTVWFWLPDGVSMHGVLSIPLEQYFPEVYSDRELKADFTEWMKGSPTRSALSRYPRILAYLMQHTTETKLDSDLQKAALALEKDPPSVPSQ